MPIAHVQCYGCAQSDPHRRTSHHFDIMEHGLDVFREHLEDAYKDHANRKEAIAGKMSWAATLIETYSRLVDSQTGASLTWCQARRQSFAEMTAQEARWRQARQQEAVGCFC